LLSFVMLEIYWAVIFMLNWQSLSRDLLLIRRVISWITFSKRAGLAGDTQRDEETD
jgi:hypothetical protein